MKKIGFYFRFVLTVSILGLVCRGWNCFYERNSRIVAQRLEENGSESTTNAVGNIKAEDAVKNVVSFAGDFVKKSTEDFKNLIENIGDSGTVNEGERYIQGKVARQNDVELPSDTSVVCDANTFYSDNLEVHFIDVGQGDSVLMKYKDGAILVDAGDNDAGQSVADYLEVEGVNTLDALFVTHPDADHCGGVDTVIETLDSVDKVYMSECEKDTYTYKEMMTCVKQHDYSIEYPEKGDVFWFKDEVKINVLSPDYDSLEGYEDVNAYSLVMQVEYGKNSVLLMGDATVDVEHMLLEDNMAVASDILKLGHHGSYTSTSDDFLDAVGAENGVVIMAEKGNEYSHPHGVVMDRIESRNLPVYRTDTQGTVECMLTGDAILWNVEECADYRDGDEIQR